MSDHLNKRLAYSFAPNAIEIIRNKKHACKHADVFRFVMFTKRSPTTIGDRHAATENGVNPQRHLSFIVTVRRRHMRAVKNLIYQAILLGANCSHVHVAIGVAFDGVGVLTSMVGKNAIQ